MKRMLVLLAAAAALLSLAACSEGSDPVDGGSAVGSLSIEAVCLPVVEARTRASVELPAGTAIPDWREMTMRIASTMSGNNYDRVWARVANYNPKKDQLLEGDYAVTIYSTSTWQGATLVEEGADKPYFEGKATDVVVERRKQTPVKITARLANTIVRIDFTDRFKRYFAGGATFTLTTKAGNAFAVGYTADDPAVEETYWYVRPVEFSITGRATKQTPSATADPETVRFAEVKPREVKPATLYTYLFDITGVGGTDGVVITLNDEPIATEVIDEELNPDSHM